MSGTNNAPVDRFTRMVRAGTITAAEARRRRAQSRLVPAQGNGGPSPSIRVQPRAVNPLNPNGYRRVQVWYDWQFSLSNHFYGVAPAVGSFSIGNHGTEESSVLQLFPTVTPLDHILVDVRLDLLPGMFDPSLFRGSVSAALWRYTDTNSIDDPDSPEDNPTTIEASSAPLDGAIRGYSGSQDIIINPGGPAMQWVFRPRPGDRVDSLRDDMPALMLALNTSVVLLRPSQGDPLTSPPQRWFSSRIGATYLVRDRAGFLL